MTPLPPASVQMFSRSAKIRAAVGLVCTAAAAAVIFYPPAPGFLAAMGGVCSCERCLGDGEHEIGRLLRASPPPFLSAKHKTPEDAFNWWKRLQGERRDYRFFNTTLNGLFRLFPPVPDVVRPDPGRCRTCAVVGNSGNLKGSRYGPLIDFHDVVMRMNHGRTEGHEDDVGTRTTHHAMYPESAVDLDERTRLLLFPFKIDDLLWLQRTFSPRKEALQSGRRRANKDLVMILNPAFIKYVHEEWLHGTGRYPSTGFLCLAVSMHLCDEVSVFGFGADDEGNWSHYFEALKNRGLRTGPHAGTREYDFMGKLHRERIIRFFKGR